jgi:hypothetical protein
MPQAQAPIRLTFLTIRIGAGVREALLQAARIIPQPVGLAAIVSESSGILPIMSTTPTSFSPCSDLETGEDLWAFNDFHGRKIHIMPSWKIQSFMDKKYGIVHPTSKLSIEED